MLRLRIVQCPAPAEIADSVTLAHCWRQANTRALTFLVLAAVYLPDDTPDDVMQMWRTCYEDAQFTDGWLTLAA